MILVEDPDFTLHVGDALETLRTMPAESVDMCVTSPPYWGLRDYGTGLWDGGDPDCDHQRRTAENAAARSTLGPNGDGLGPGNQTHKVGWQYGDVCGKCGATRQDQQLGLEATPDLYVQNMVAVFREVRRVLKPHGSCWVNLGDSYSGGGGYAPDAPVNVARREAGSGMDGRFKFSARVHDRQLVKPKQKTGLKPKDLVGVPWRVAFALQADGWYLRSDIIWSKPNPMPESVTDRPTKAHEYVFLLAKQPRYFFDAEAVREPPSDYERKGGTAAWTADSGHTNGVGSASFHQMNPAGRNVRSVWEIATHPYAEAHFATYPRELVRRCILAGSSECGVCRVCGAPWERVLVSKRTDRRPGTSVKLREITDGNAAQTGRGGDYEVTTLGWRQTCEHAHLCETVPATVLDPFLGSGTTALVAREQGRRCVGIELNEEYAEMAARRLSQLSLLAEPVLQTTEGKGSSDEQSVSESSP